MTHAKFISDLEAKLREINERIAAAKSVAERRELQRERAEIERKLTSARLQ